MVSRETSLTLLGAGDTCFCFPNVDLWDAVRDARLYPGTCLVVTRAQCGPRYAYNYASISKPEDANDGQTVSRSPQIRGLRENSSMGKGEPRETQGVLQEIQGRQQRENSPSEEGVEKGQSREASSSESPVENQHDVENLRLQRTTAEAEWKMCDLSASRQWKKAVRSTRDRPLSCNQCGSRIVVSSVQFDAWSSQGQHRNSQPCYRIPGAVK